MDEKILEQAGDFVDGLVAEGVTNARKKPPRPAGFDGFCTCGAEIPEARVAMELYNCVGCQEALERRSKLYRSW